VGLIAAVFMLGAGGALAVFVLAAMKIHRLEETPGEARPPQRDSVAASLLFHVLRAGGVSSDEALRQLRRGTGFAAPVTQGIDVGNWAESYARHSSDEQRRTLLETAVQLIAAREGPVPWKQYVALLDLSFGLGFHTDALAKLRQSYGFEFVDPGRDRPSAAGAPKTAAGAAAARAELLTILGVGATATRQELSAAYRRLVLQHHPDRFHGAPAEAQKLAAARFIEITRAYEELLPTCGE
jgi:hypothetical protein